MTAPRTDATLPETSDLQRLARTELSRAARTGHIVLLLAAACMTTVVASLWLTEPALPARTSAAFAVMTIIGLAWVAFALWVLAQKHALLVRQRLVAGRMAVAFCGLFAGGAMVIAVTTGQRAAWTAAAMGALPLGAAVFVWRRAVADVATLVARRDELARELARRPQ